MSQKSVLRTRVPLWLSPALTRKLSLKVRTRFPIVHSHTGIHRLQGGWNETPPQTKSSSYGIMNCFQHTPESCGALINPLGEHRTKKAPLHKHALTGFTAHAYSFKRLARLPLPNTPPLSPVHLTPQTLAFVPFGVKYINSSSSSES